MPKIVEVFLEIYYIYIIDLEISFQIVNTAYGQRMVPESLESIYWIITLILLSNPVIC